MENEKISYFIDYFSLLKCWMSAAAVVTANQVGCNGRAHEESEIPSSNLAQANDFSLRQKIIR